MARISKPGLDYFPLDVNFLQDRKVRRIASRHHAAGIAALTSILCLIYKEKGYYVSWNQDTLFDIAQEICCKEKEMQAIIDDCLSVGLFDTYIYKEYKVLTSQSIQEQYHKIIIDSRRKYKLPLEKFWLIKDESPENETETPQFDAIPAQLDAIPAQLETSTFQSATIMPQTKQQTESDNTEERKNKNEIKMRDEIDKEKAKTWETTGNSKKNASQATPVVVEGLSLDLLQLNMKAIGIQNEQTIQAITALARRKELGGPGGILWKILSSEYRPTLLKKNEPGDYILWALNHSAEFEDTYNGTLKRLVRGR